MDEVQIQNRKRKSESQTVETLLKDYFMDNILPENSLNIPGNEWLQTQTTPLSNALLYANGRFQGLFPGLPGEKGYGGHPGIIFKLIMTALCFQIPSIGISVSSKTDAEKNPVNLDKKKQVMEQIIANFRRLLPENIERNTNGEIPSSIIRTKLENISIHIVPLVNPIATTISLKESFESSPNILIMTSGLELNNKTGLEYNKYEKTFNSIVGPDQEKPFKEIRFLLTSRLTKDKISGTVIRELVESNEYKQLAKYLFDAGFVDDDSLQLYGNLVANIKTGLSHELSQPEEDYAFILSMYTHEIARDELEELSMLREKVALDEDENNRLSYLEKKEKFLNNYIALPTGGRRRRKQTKRRHSKNKTKKRCTRKKRNVKQKSKRH